MQILESSHTIGSFNIFVYSLNHTFGVFAISESWLIPPPPPQQKHLWNHDCVIPENRPGGRV